MAIIDELKGNKKEVRSRMSDFRPQTSDRLLSASYKVFCFISSNCYKFGIPIRMFYFKKTSYLKN